MCGRYTLFSKKKIYSKFNVKIEKNYNISPRQNVWIIDENFSTLSHKWGFVKEWYRKKFFIFNARSETIKNKNVFKNLKRCIFLADGYYEWVKSDKKKLPYYHYLKNELVFFAGLYNDQGCCIGTTQSSNYLSFIHHRQPLYFTEEFIELWLKSKEEKIICNKLLHYIPVSEDVNKIWNNSPELISRSFSNISKEI